MELGRIEARIETRVRLCREEDLPALEWMGLYAPDRRLIRETFAGQLRGEQLMLIAVAADFPVAQVWVDLARKAQEGAAVLWAVRTFHPLQRAGIGSRMIGIAENVLSDRGIARAELEAEPEAAAFYARLGWRCIGADPEDPMRVLMAKHLFQAA